MATSGMIVPGDVVLAASYSGTTEELLRLVETLKRLGVPLVVMTANAASPARPATRTSTCRWRSTARPAR